MLVLTRRIGEQLYIGEEVVVHILDIRGNQVRVGVEAPRQIQVHRKEVYDRIQEEDAVDINVDTMEVDNATPTKER